MLHPSLLPRRAPQAILAIAGLGHSAISGGDRALLPRQRSEVRILSGAPLRNKTGRADSRRFPATRGDEGAKQRGFVSHDAHFAIVYFYPLGERPEMVAAIAASAVAHPFARRAGESRERLWGDGWSGLPLGHLGTVGVVAGLISDRLELDHAVLEQRIGKIGDTVLDRVVEPLELRLCLGGALSQLRDMRGAAFGPLVPAGRESRIGFLRGAPISEAAFQGGRRRVRQASPSG